MVEIFHHPGPRQTEPAIGKFAIAGAVEIGVPDTIEQQRRLRQFLPLPRRDQPQPVVTTTRNAVPAGAPGTVLIAS